MAKEVFYNISDGLDLNKIATKDFLVDRFTTQEYTQKIEKKVEKLKKQNEKLKSYVNKVTYSYREGQDVLLKSNLRHGRIVELVPIDNIYDGVKYKVVLEYSTGWDNKDSNAAVWLRDDEIEPYPGLYEHNKRLTYAYVELLNNQKLN